MSAKHIIISGRVQGVGFRQYVLQEAKKLRLKGWVRNLEDGRVEVLVQTEESLEKAFLEVIRKGPTFSKVTDVEVRLYNKDVKFSDFVVREDGSSPYVE